MEWGFYAKNCLADAAWKRTLPCCFQGSVLFIPLVSSIVKEELSFRQS